MTKEWREGFALFHEQIALSLTENEWFTQKTRSEFPTLAYSCDDGTNILVYGSDDGTDLYGSYDGTNLW